MPLTPPPRPPFYFFPHVNLLRNIFSRRTYNTLSVTVEQPTGKNADAFFAELATITRQTGGITHAFCDDRQQPVGYVQLHRSGGEITIHRIWTIYPKRGIGSRMLSQLCELADRHQVFIKLKVAPLGPAPVPMSAEELGQWYRRHGFRGQRKMLRAPLPSKSHSQG